MKLVLSNQQIRVGLLLTLVLLPFLSFFVSRVQAATYTMTVDTVFDDTLASLIGNGDCELREAIAIVNLTLATSVDCGIAVAPNASDDFEIFFNVPLLGPADVISLQSNLPAITQPLVIDGTDQGGSGFVMHLQEAAGFTVDYGLRFLADTDGSSISNVWVEGFSVGLELVDATNISLITNTITDNGMGILVRGTLTQDISIEGNFVGFDNIITNAAAGNDGDGIRVQGSARNVDIINTNVVVDNGNYGIILNGVRTATVQANAVGDITLAGGTPLGNGSHGIRVVNSRNVDLIGNTVLNNSGHGIQAQSSPTTVIDGNNIGQSGIAAGNGNAGIWINSNRVTVRNNTIANNGGNGITIPAGTGNRLSQNLIFANDELGIDLDNNGVTPNDAGDVDTGANNRQNFPGVSAAWMDGANLRIAGFMNSAGGTYTVELYDNPLGCNRPTGLPAFGEGQVYETSATIGTERFTITVPAGGFAANDTLTLLAIDSAGNTSEFSNCITILAARPTATPSPTVTPIPPTPLPTTPSPLIPTNTLALVPSLTPSLTVTPLPSNTPVPSNTPAPTRTPLPTATASNTATTIPSRTPLPTRTATNTATVTLTATETIAPTNTAIPSPTGTPNIDITKVSDGDDDVTIDIVNNGNSTAPDVIVIEELRDDVEYRAATSGQATCVETAGLVTCRVGDIPAGATAQVNVNVNSNGVDPASGETTVIVGGVTVAMVNEPYIIKVGNPPVAAPGAEIVYTIRVINPTSESAFNMLIRDEMPEGIEIISGESTAGELDIDGQNVQLTLDELAAGERVTLTLITRVSDEEIFPQIINTACVTSSSNPAPRCAQMSFLRAGQLPNTGEIPIIVGFLRWAGVLLMTGFMLAGLLIFWRRMRRV